MAGTVIPMGKSRKPSAPYLTVVSNDGWTWRVLKAYSHGPEARFARWYCEVTSPFSVDLGDVYIQDIRGRIVERDISVPDSAIPGWLL